MSKLPAGWQSGTLGDLADTVMGYAFKSTDFVLSGIPLLRMGNLYQNLLDLDRSPVFLPDSFKVQYSKFLVKAGDLVMSMTGTMGKRDYGFTVQIPNGASDSLLNQRIIKFITKKDADTVFLLNLLRSELTLCALYSFPGGTKQANLSAKQILNLPALIPPLAEQTKIAKILSTWDKAIATTERLLANKQQQKQALAQRLLTGRKRHKQFSDSWTNYRLGELFERVTKKNTENNTNVVSISAQQGLIRQDEFFKKSVASETLEGYYLLSHGQFAYNKSYSNGYPMGAIKRLNRYEKGVVTTLYICFAISDHANCCPVFFEQFFDAGLLNEGLAQVAHEGGRAHGLLNVKPSDFFSLKVKVPSLEEQQKIAQMLTTADAEIANLQAQLAALKLEKKALMQQLLTGQRRVKLDDEAATPIRVG